jgi:hypothetical protein
VNWATALRRAGFSAYDRSHDPPRRTQQAGVIQSRHQRLPAFPCESRNQRRTPTANVCLTWLPVDPTAGSIQFNTERGTWRKLTLNWSTVGLGRPGAVGAQNDLRYAVFPESGRLVLDDHGTISVYATGDHRIFGVAQAQSGDQTLSFTSQDGLVRVADLRKVDG